MSKLINIFKYHILPNEHLGIILRVNLKEIIKEININDLNYQILKDKNEIISNYSEFGIFLKFSDVDIMLKNGGKCFVIYKDNIVVSLSMILFGQIHHKALSGRVFTKDKVFSFDDRNAYIRHEIVKPQLRSKGIGKIALFLLLKYLRKNRVENVFVTMGADNIGNIKKWMNLGAQLVGIVNIKSCLGVIRRKEYFLDLKHKFWV